MQLQEIHIGDRYHLQMVKKILTILGENTKYKEYEILSI